MKLDYSLYGLLNHFLATGLGFFIALLASKKKKKQKSSLETSRRQDYQQGEKQANPVVKFIKTRFIRVSLAVLYIVVFFLFFRYSKFHYTQLITLAVSAIIFFLFLRLKKIIGSVFVLLIIAFIAMFIMLNRSLYLLFKEETVGRIKIINSAADFITMRIEELDDGDIKKVHEKVRVRGNQIGIFAYQLYYKKWISFLGFEHKFLWAGVLGVKFRLAKRDRAKANLDIYILDPNNYAKNQKIWTNLEQKELFLPGVRTVQRLIVLKIPVKGLVYKIIKHRTGQITIEQND